VRNWKNATKEREDSSKSDLEVHESEDIHNSGETLDIQLFGTVNGS
jgi:hypothetical protein